MIDSSKCKNLRELESKVKTEDVKAGIIWGVTSKCWQLKIVDLAHGNEKGVLVLVYGYLEQGPTTNDLQPGQYDLFDVNVTDEHVARDLSDVLQKGEVIVAIL